MKIINPKTGKEKNVKLPKVFKAKWLKALRSGKFKQAQAQLCVKEGDSVSYCCLGVACRIVHPKMDLEEHGLIAKSQFRNKYESVRVPKLLHGGTDTSMLDFNPVVKTLTDMNDGGSSFKQIANFISKNL